MDRQEDGEGGDRYSPAESEGSLDEAGDWTGQEFFSNDPQSPSGSRLRSSPHPHASSPHHSSPHPHISFTSSRSPDPRLSRPSSSYTNSSRSPIPPRTHSHSSSHTPSAPSPSSVEAPSERRLSGGAGGDAPPKPPQHRRSSLTGASGKGPTLPGGGASKVAAHLTLEVRGRKIADLYAFMSDQSKSAAERLSCAVKVHQLLCDGADHEEVMERLDAITLPSHIEGLISLSTVQHPLNYTAFRLLLLYTHTSKCIVMLSRGGVMTVIMDRLRVSQEKEGLKFLIEVLARVARSAECRHAGSLSQVAHLDAQVLVRLLSEIDHNTYAHTRLQVLQTLEAMSVCARSRQALLRSGVLYAILDLLGQFKRGKSFSKAELGLLATLKQDLLFWEHSAHMKAI